MALLTVIFLQSQLTVMLCRHVQSREDAELCSICFDNKLEVVMIGASGPCGHQMCAGCAFQLCGRGLDAPSCPFCRADIGAFESAQK